MWILLTINHALIIMALNRGDTIEFFMTWILPIILGLSLGYLLMGRKKTARGNINVLSKEDFKQNMRKGQLIDLRKQADYEKDKIKGARNFSAGYLKSKQQTKVRKDQPLYLYCERGWKSKRVAKKLAKKRFGQINVLKGGFKHF